MFTHILHSVNLLMCQRYSYVIMKQMFKYYNMIIQEQVIIQFNLVCMLYNFDIYWI